MKDKIETGGPAFPMQYADDSYQTGMTLRDYFAAKAMQVILAADGVNDWKTRAEHAYAMAEAMLEVRNEK
jgi:hypothetical protein